jgi:hypothetical protein
MKKIITAVCVILIIAVIIYAILSHSSSSSSNSNSSSSSSTNTTCNKNEEYVGNACQCKSAFVRDFGGNCSSQCGDNQIVINGNCQCKDGYIKDKNECKNSPVPVHPLPSPPLQPSCGDISHINASGVCTKWDLIQTYDAPSVLGGISEKGLVVYTPNGIKVNDRDVYKDNINIQIFSSLNIGVDSTSIIYMYINGQWSKDQRLKSDGIIQVKENSTKFFAMSGVNIYTMEKNENSAWINNSLPPNSSFVNVNDRYTVAWGSDAYLSSDFGKSWNKISVSGTVYYCYLSSDALLIATDSGVYKTNLPNINFTQILNFPVGSDYRTSCINQYNDEIVVVSQDSLDTNMMSLYIFYSPNNGTDFIKLNVVTENNFQLWCPFNVYVYNGVIYAISMGIKTSATDFIQQNKNFLYKFNVK